MPRILCACLLAASVILHAAETPEPGKTYFGRNQYVEYIAGSLPFVLSAAHGGRDKPEELPDRAKGTFAFDTNTQELARAIDDEFVARTGQHPHVVICRVTRRKIDCNREIVEGAAGHPLTEQQVDHLFNETKAFPGYQLTIDLERQEVIAPDNRSYSFEVTPFRKYCLVNGLDDIGLTLRHADKIKAFEAERLLRMPWLATQLP